MKEPKTPEYIYYKRTNLHEQREYFERCYRELSFRKQIVVDYMLNKNRKQKHRLHVVAPSPGPIYSAASAFLFVIGMILGMNYYTMTPLLCGFFSIIMSFIFGFRDIVREGVYMGYHTEIVQSCLRLGFVLFLVSEVMFFFGFFGALFHYTLTPGFFIGGVGPPQGIVLHLMAEDVNGQTKREATIGKSQIPFLRTTTHFRGRSVLVYERYDFEHLSRHYDYFFSKKLKKPKLLSFFVDSEIYAKVLHTQPEMQKELFCKATNITINFYCRGVLVNPYKIPLLNTALLLTSGIILTLSHSYLRVEWFLPAFRCLNATIVFGLLFIYLQGYEYGGSCFALNDGVYGSIFYMLTGFHGVHVIIGTIFLIVCSYRMGASHFTSNNHFAFEAAAGYGHFVDVVGILLYLLVYLGPNAKYFGMNGGIIINPFSDTTTVINLNTTYYGFKCNQDKGGHFYAGINFELHYDIKTKVMKFILAHFEKEVRIFERRHSMLLKELGLRKFNALRAYTRW